MRAIWKKWLHSACPVQCRCPEDTWKHFLKTNPLHPECMLTQLASNYVGNVHSLSVVIDITLSLMLLSVFMFPTKGTDDQWSPKSCLFVFFLRFFQRFLQCGQRSAEETGNWACSGSSHLGLYHRETVLIKQVQKGTQERTVASEVPKHFDGRWIQW